MNLIICGNGVMAHEMQRYCNEHGVTSINFDQVVSGNADSKAAAAHGVAIHFGSGRQLPDLIKWCEAEGVPLIQGTTGITNPDSPRVCGVIAPNLSPVVIAFLRLVKEAGKLLPEIPAFIEESHQKEKKGISGTALRAAEILGIGEACITSERDLSHPHGEHNVMFKIKNSAISLKVGVVGRDPYMEGALGLAKGLDENREGAKPGWHHIEDDYIWRESSPHTP